MAKSTFLVPTPRCRDNFSASWNFPAVAMAIAMSPFMLTILSETASC